MTDSDTAVKEFNYALRLFFVGLDKVSDSWLTNSHELREHQNSASDARNRVVELSKSIVKAIIPPTGQTAVQFVAGILDDVENAWHLCRCVTFIDPIEDEERPDFKRIQDEMHHRLPALRNTLWEAWRHIRHTRELLGTEPEKPTPNSGTKNPTWNRERRKLFFAGQEIKSVRSLDVAKNVVLVLDTFELDGWAYRIDSPLPDDSKTLHETSGDYSTLLY